MDYSDLEEIQEIGPEYIKTQKDIVDKEIFWQC